jgi:DtxR family Mn-dependent transcriptional regulator
LAFSSSERAANNAEQPLSALGVGARGTVHHVATVHGARFERLAALGVTPGAPVTVLQTFPGVVFLCDQTELAIERAIADVIFIRTSEG